MSKKVFISYSNDDKNKMRSLEKRLKSGGVLTPIIIADDRKPSVLLSDKVKRGIEECDYFVPILTKRSIINQWVNQEIGYATALKRSIVPLVEAQIINKLKGFIHKQTDLPFQFKSNTKSAHSEASIFSKRAKVLANHLLLENEILPEEVSAENFFPGIWECEYTLNGKKGIDPRVEIKNGNDYYSNGKLYFKVDDLRIDLKKGGMSFTKCDPKDGSRIAHNVLRIVKLNERYEGLENGQTPIAYYRID
ncbi:MAG: toll/interleukin-1 receptor domain-containing protein [Flavobacteriales bacterium]|nr:toll/interleukin-1 receptor domain-containing protein [Flavobacteriales bacterium]